MTELRLGADRDAAIALPRPCALLQKTTQLDGDISRPFGNGCVTQ